MSAENIEQEAQKAFIRDLTENQASLRSYIISLMPGQPGALDVLQEVNITLWDKWKSFEPGTNFTAWSFAVARYSVLEHRRKLRKDHHLIFSDELLDTLSLDPEDVVPEQIEERQHALENCLANLSPSDRELINRRYSRGHTLEDYSREVGRSANSLRVALFRIRAALKICINRQVKRGGTPA